MSFFQQCDSRSEVDFICIIGDKMSHLHSSAISNSKVCQHAQSKQKHTVTLRHFDGHVLLVMRGKNTRADGSRESALTDRLSAVILITKSHI